MRTLFAAMVLIVAASVFVTGCNKSGTNEQAAKKTEPTKTEDKKPQEKTAEPTKIKELIVGRWEGTDSKGRPAAVEFTAFGTVTAVRPDRGSGKYLVSNDGGLDMEFENSDRKESQRCTINIADGELRVTDSEGDLASLFVLPGKYKQVKVFSAAVKPISGLVMGKWKYVSGSSGSFNDNLDPYELEFKKGGEFAGQANCNGGEPFNGKYTTVLDESFDPAVPVVDISISNMGNVTQRTTTLKLGPTRYSVIVVENTLKMQQVHRGSDGKGFKGTGFFLGLK